VIRRHEPRLARAEDGPLTPADARRRGWQVGYPEKAECGQEDNVTKSDLNPHYFFPVTFGGFKVGTCAQAGFGVFDRSEVVAMHPFPGVSHNLTFDLYRSA
jgi:hypothetical protein